MTEDVRGLRARGIALQRETAAGQRAATVRLRVLSSFNLDLLPPLLVEALDRRGVAADVDVGGFGQISEEIFDRESSLYRGERTDVLVVPAVEDVLAAMYAGPLSAAEQDELVAARLDEMGRAISTLLERLEETTCYVVAFGAARPPLPQVLDPGSPARGQRSVTRFLDGVREFAALSPRVVVVDWDWHARLIGTASLNDDRLWYLARMRLNPPGLAELGDLVARHVAAYHGLARKVAAVDLDGTLWGGILGEAGLMGLQLGDEEAGLAFKDFQRELLRLRESGVVLVACSKNDREDAIEVFERHPGMVLRAEHFAAERINWQDKATNLEEIAAELGLALDSFVFLDDDPVEREWIRTALPAVAVPDLPGDPARRPAFLRESGLFERIVLTETDVARGRMYAAQADRARLRTDSVSFSDFLRSLEQEVTFAPADLAALPRAAQLCQRTNQFNLTTRRHTIAELERLLWADQAELYTIAVTDRFGDSGVTGVAILVFDGPGAEIDTFLLSCRVLGRRVENAMLAFIAGRAAARGRRRLIAPYVPTSKNRRVERFLGECGFAAAPDGGFELDPFDHDIPMPQEMTIKVSDRCATVYAS